MPKTKEPAESRKNRTHNRAVNEQARASDFQMRSSDVDAINNVAKRAARRQEAMRGSKWKKEQERTGKYEWADESSTYYSLKHTRRD